MEQNGEDNSSFILPGTPVSAQLHLLDGVQRRAWAGELWTL